MNRNPYSSPGQATNEPKPDPGAILSVMLQELVNKVKTHILALRRSHNNILPIHRLPCEVFLGVIHVLLQGHSSRIRALEGCTLVCSSWRSAITAAPALWSVISVHDPPTSITKAIRLSNLLPLDIRMIGCTNTYDTAGGVERTLHPSLPDVCQIAERWRSVELQLNWRSEEHLEHLELANAPHLEVLKLKVQKRYSAQQYDLFGGLADRLRVLHLEGIRIPLGLLLQVHDLELGDVWLSPIELVQLVESNGALCRLVLPGVTTTSSSESLFPPKYSIRHNNLRDINFGAKISSPATYLLPFLLLRNCHTISVVLGDQPENGTLSPATHATLGHIAKHASDPVIQTIDLTWIVRPGGAGSFSCKASFKRPGSCKLQISIPLSFNQGARWAMEVMKTLGHSAKMEIGLEIHWDEGRRAGDIHVDLNLIRVLGQLPRVRAITCRSGLSPPFMELMSRPIRDGDVGRWLFPELDEFIYVDTSHKLSRLPLILSMVKNRYSMESGSLASAACPPKQMEILQLPVWARATEVAVEIFRASNLSPKYV